MIRFDFNALNLVANTAQIFLLDDATDNPTFSADATARIDLDTKTAGYWLNELCVTRTASLEVEIGICTAAKGSFTPVYPSINGSNECELMFYQARVLIKKSGDANKVAIRITSRANVNPARVSGHIDVQQRGS